MAYRRQKISQMPPKGANLEATDLLEISEVSGTGYITKSITGQEIINAASGGTIDLQTVTDNGSTTTNSIEVTAGPNESSTVSGLEIITENAFASTSAKLVNTGALALKTGAEESSLQNTAVTSPGVILEFPDKASGSYTIATTSDLTSGYVPYTGATANVDLGTFHLDAAKGTFTHNGSTDTLTANHTSGAGIGLLITKGGNNEGLKVNKTSGSGNAATIIGTLEATTIVKTGGTSTQFLMADGTTSLGGGITVGTTPVTSGTDGRVFFQAGGVVQQDSAFTFTQAQTALRIARSGTPSSPLLSLGNSTASAKAGLKIWNGSTTETNGAELFVNTDNNIYLKSNNANSIILASSTTNVLTISSNQASLTRLNINGATTTPVFSIASVGTTATDYPFYISGLASSKLNLMNGLGQFGINKPSNTLGANLDVSASGALSTDIAFRVRNSADTADIFSVNGNGVFYKPHASSNNDVAQDVFVSQMSDGRNKIRLFTKGSFNVSSAIGISFQSDAAGSFISSYTLSGAFLNSGSSYQDNGGLSVFNVGTSNVAGYSFLRLKNNLGTQDNIYLSRTGTIILNPDNSNAQVRGLSIFGGILGASADRVISIGSGTAPTTSPADAFQQYSADITAGNAAPHFRTENGAIVKVYQETTGVGASTLVSGIGTPLTDTDTFDGYTLKQIVKALRNQGLLA